MLKLVITEENKKEIKKLYGLINEQESKNFQWYVERQNDTLPPSVLYFNRTGDSYAVFLGTSTTERKPEDVQLLPEPLYKLNEMTVTFDNIDGKITPVLTGLSIKSNELYQYIKDTMDNSKNKVVLEVDGDPSVGELYFIGSPIKGGLDSKGMNPVPLEKGKTITYGSSYFVINNPGKKSEYGIGYTIGFRPTKKVYPA